MYIIILCIYWYRLISTSIDTNLTLYNSINLINDCGNTKSQWCSFDEVYDIVYAALRYVCTFLYYIHAKYGKADKLQKRPGLLLKLYIVHKRNHKFTHSLYTVWSFFSCCNFSCFMPHAYMLCCFHCISVVFAPVSVSGLVVHAQIKSDRERDMQKINNANKIK